MASLGLGGWLLLSACQPAPPQIAELHGETMGTSYSIKLSPAPEEAVRTTLKAEIDRRLELINSQMSTYRPDSDLMQFNRSPSTDWQRLPPEIVGLVTRANHISHLTGGRYDITVGPLVNLWGFGSSGDRTTAPARDEVEDILARVGFRHLHTRTQPAALRKEIPELEIDLSSIAKGWAVDEVVDILNGKGLHNHLVEIGGELRAQGEKAPGRPWRIAIEQPDFDNRSVQRVIALDNMAMATSGDYRNFFADGDRLYSHTIDPDTGQPVRHRLASVTVLAGDCTSADAWATALMAVGEPAAFELADSQGLKALFITRSGSELQETASRALRESGLLEQP